MLKMIQHTCPPVVLRFRFFPSLIPSFPHCFRACVLLLVLQKRPPTLSPRPQGLLLPPLPPLSLLLPHQPILFCESSSSESTLLWFISSIHQHLWDCLSLLPDSKSRVQNPCSRNRHGREWKGGSICREEQPPPHRAVRGAWELHTPATSPLHSPVESAITDVKQ